MMMLNDVAASLWRHNNAYWENLLADTCAHLHTYTHRYIYVSMYLGMRPESSECIWIWVLSCAARCWLLAGCLAGHCLRDLLMRRGVGELAEAEEKTAAAATANEKEKYKKNNATSAQHKLNLNAPHSLGGCYRSCRRCRTGTLFTVDHRAVVDSSSPNRCTWGTPSNLLRSLLRSDEPLASPIVCTKLFVSSSLW